MLLEITRFRTILIECIELFRDDTQLLLNRREIVVEMLRDKLTNGDSTRFPFVPTNHSVCLVVELEAESEFFGFPSAESQ